MVLLSTTLAPWTIRNPLNLIYLIGLKTSYPEFCTGVVPLWNSEVSVVRDCAELFWFVRIGSELFWLIWFWFVAELLELFDDGVDEGINPFAEVRIVPARFWNCGVPAPALAEPGIKIRFFLQNLVKNINKTSDVQIHSMLRSFLAKL